MVTVLVTGGAGYIGSHACKVLAQAGYTPVTYDNLSRGHRSAVKWGPFEHGDLLDDDRLNEVLSIHKPQAVMHFAALALVGESVDHPDLYFRNNVDGSRVLIEAMIRADVSKIVFSSTCAVYGLPKHVPIGETAPVNPINPYGETKLAVEQMLAKHQKSGALSYMALRYFNAAGADPDGDIGEDHDPEPHLIPRVLFAATGKDSLVVNGNNYPTPDGTCIRDYVHATDLALAHLAALELLESGSGSESNALNLGTGKGFSILEVIKTAEKVTGHKISFQVGDPRPGDPPALVADNRQAQSVLGWKPERSDLETMIADAWRWARTN